MDWQDLQGCMEESPEGLCFKNMLALEPDPAGRAKEGLQRLMYPAAVKVMVARLFDGLGR
jgi:hypothetical protein